MRRWFIPGVVGLGGGFLGAGLFIWNQHLRPVWAHLHIAGLATLVGLIGTLGGLITVLVGLFSLSQVDERLEGQRSEMLAKIQSDLKEFGAEQTRALEEKFRTLQQQGMQALTISSMTSWIGNPDDLVAYAEKALQLFPELPYLREQIGLRFASATVTWHWQRIAGAFFQQTVQNNLSPNDYHMRAAEWLEKAVEASQRVPLERPGEVYLRLAQMYALDQQWRRAEENWQQYLNVPADNRRMLNVPDWAILAIHAPSLEAISDMMKTVGQQQIGLDDPRLFPTEKLVYWLGVRSNGLGYQNLEPVVIQIRLVGNANYAIILATEPSTPICTFDSPQRLQLCLSEQSIDILCPWKRQAIPM